MKKTLSRIYTGLILLFLYAPIFVLIAFSFNASKSRSNFTHFTTKWYVELFHNELIMTSFWNTIKVAILAAVFSTILGVFAALGISVMRKRSKAIMMNVTYLPVINPEIVTGISMMLLFVYFVNVVNLIFGEGTIELGMWSVLVAHITFCVPYVVLNVLPKLAQMDNNLYEAAMDLGCTPFQSFMKVVVPDIMPGIISGFLMAFTYSLDDFVITYFTNGSSFQTLPITIYSMTRKKVNPQINALSAILFVLVLFFLVLSNMIQNRSDKKDE